MRTTGHLGFVALCLTLTVWVQLLHGEVASSGGALPVPAMPWWALALLGGVLAAAAALVFRRRG